MAKEKLKLSLEQEADRAAEMTSEEAADLAAVLKGAAKTAEDVTDEKHEGRVSMELDDGKIVVSVTKVKIEKEDA